MKRRPRTVTNKNRAKKAAGIPTWKFYTLVALSSVLLIGGFFVAARNQFSSVTYGFKNSELRKELENLEAEKRRLILSREVALSPAEIGKAARKLGLSTMTARNVGTYQSSDPVVAKKSAQPNEKPRVAGQILASMNASAPPKKGSRTNLVSKTVSSSNAGSRN